MMDGLGIARRAVSEGPIEPEAIAYRALLDRCTGSPPWFVGAAVMTIFVEGSVHERAERRGDASELPIEEVIVAHPMVRFYGCPPGAMRLARAHRAVEGDHRKDAWDMLLRHVPGGPEAAETGRRGRWNKPTSAGFRYRDGVARAMGLYA